MRSTRWILYAVLVLRMNSCLYALHGIDLTERIASGELPLRVPCLPIAGNSRSDSCRLSRFPCNMSSSAPTKYAVALFPGFQLLDVAGPLDILNILGYHTHFDSLPAITLSILANSLDPVSTSHAPVAGRSNFSESIVPTHTFRDAPQDIEVLLIPGGRGARDDANIQPIIDFVKDRYQNLQHIITVCTGSAILAMTGLLDGKKATTNKASYEWVSHSFPYTLQSGLSCFSGYEQGPQCGLGA